MVNLKTNLKYQNNSSIDSCHGKLIEIRICFDLFSGYRYEKIVLLIRNQVYEGVFILSIGAIDIFGDRPRILLGYTLFIIPVMLGALFSVHLFRFIENIYWDTRTRTAPNFLARSDWFLTSPISIILSYSLTTYMGF